MEYLEITPNDYPVFLGLLNPYYREGEDAQTPQEEIDGFIRLLFDMVMQRKIFGCFAKDGGEIVGFSLWVVDTPDFAFSQMPGYGTVLEIGMIPACRAAGWGKALVSHAEDCLRSKGAKQCYVSSYGPAQDFWARCGYAYSGQKADNGLPIMVKNIAAE